MNIKDKTIKKNTNIIIKMINDGFCYRDINRKTGFSISTISRIRKKYLLNLIGDMKC